MIESLTEMSEAVQTCARELFLYKDSKLQDLIARLYAQLFGALKILSKFHLTPRLARLSKVAGIRAEVVLKEHMAEMRKLSQAVLREVDYQHRFEQREISSRVVDMQIEQRKILTTLEAQRRILKSLQEERRIIGVVKEQQKILQIVQQIQGSMQIRGQASRRAPKSLDRKFDDVLDD